tara:strand:- start:518 stop:793 length:276 start_codon:yes stop_codon:yes gene_type:complete
MKNCQVLILKNNQILVSQLEPTEAELPGEPDVRLIDPCVLNTEGEEKGTLTKWLEGITIQNEMMIHSDQILTIVEPVTVLTQDYNEVLQER